MIRTGKNIVSVFALALSILLAPLAVAQSEGGPQVFATVDRNQMNEGDTFTLTISVSSDKSFNVSDPRLPDLSNFDLINTWKGSESQGTFTNGKFEVRRTQTFNYLLAPKTKGKFELAGAEVVVDGKAFTTKPVMLTVMAGPPSGAPPSSTAQVDPLNEQMDEMDALFSQLLQRRMQPGIKTQPVNPNEAFFLQVELDKKKVYVGEQITASWYLYTRGQIRDIDTLKYPSLNGFWKEDIEVATRLDFTNEVVNGLVYKKALLVSYALFPIKKGKTIVDSYKAKCTVLSMNQFGFGQPMVFTKASRPLDIEVLPLPEEGKPKDFGGAVGQFQLATKLDSESAPVNQPVSLKVRFEGRGNAKLIDLPQLNLPPSVEVYSTKADAKFFKNGTSYKEFEVLLIPREPGEITIPAMTLTAFDPESEKYYTKSSVPLHLKVVPGVGNEVIPSTPLTDRARPEGEKESSSPVLLVAWENASGLTGAQVAGAWSAAYGLAFVFLFWRARRELGWGRRRKNINRLLAERMKKVYQRLDKGDWRGVGAEMTNTVYFTLGELAGIGGANVELEKLLLQAPPSVRREVGEALVQQMSSFEALSFAPESVIGDMKEKPQLKKLVAQMEKLLQRAVILGAEEAETAAGPGTGKSGSANA